MSRWRSASSGPSQQKDEGEVSLIDPRTKRKKLEQNAHLPMQDVTIPKVNINDLPDEALLVILSFLTFTELINVVQNVCIRWLRLSHDPVLWRNKKLYIGIDDSDDAAMNALCEVPQLRSVVMERSVKAAVINTLCKKCRHLNSLEFEYSQKISCPLLTKLVKNCQNIRSLKIPNLLLADEKNAKVLGQLKRLKQLDIMDSYGCDKPIILHPLANGCPELAKLKLPSMVKVSTTDLAYFIKVRCETLTHLVFPWTWYKKRNILLQLKMCHSLISLELTELDSNGTLNQETMEAFTAMGNLSSLRSLILDSDRDDPFGVPAHAFKSGNLSHLWVLDITECKIENNCMEAICTCCPELQQLLLKRCNGLNDESLRLLHQLRKLKKLELENCKDLHGAAILHVSRIPTLRQLLLTECDLKKLQPGLERILDISSLEVLSFSFTHYACSFPFDLIPGNLVNLRILDVTDCELDKRVLKRLKEQMPGLKIRALEYTEDVGWIETSI